MQLVNTQRNTDLSDLIGVYEASVMMRQVIYEAPIDIPTGDEDIDSSFNRIIEINVSIATGTEIGDVQYKCDVDRDKSTSQVLTGIVRDNPDMSIVVTKLPSNNNSLNVQLYDGGEVVERFVTTIAFYDEDEMELNITKQELV